LTVEILLPIQLLMDYPMILFGHFTAIKKIDFGLVQPMDWQ
jgi:hypothetical protein